jgi:MATE family multidrug resistance protein
MFGKKYTAHYKTNLALAGPVMLSQLGHVMVGVTDNLMVGQVGVEALDGAAVANSVFIIFMVFGVGVSFGMTPLIAQADGQNNGSEISSVLKHGLLLNSILGFILFGLAIGSTSLLDYMGQSSEVVELARPYLWVVGASILPFMLFQTFRQYAEGLSLTKPAMYISLVANLLNVVLNYILIFGKMGFEPMGLLGAGIATLISRIVMAIAMFILVIQHNKLKGYYRYMSQCNIQFVKIKELLQIGVPSGLQFIFEVSAFAFASIMAGWISITDQAAHQIAISLASISYMIASGIGAAATIRVGNQLSKKDYTTLRTVGYSSFSMGIYFMAFAGIVFALGRHFLPSLYIDEPEVLEIAATLMIIAVMFQLSDGVQVVGLGTLRGMSDVKIPTMITLFAYWVIGLPVAYYLGFTLDMGVEGIWYGLFIGLSVSAALLLARFNSLTKALQHKNSNAS